jgi:hypothetical protein
MLKRIMLSEVATDQIVSAAIFIVGSPLENWTDHRPCWTMGIVLKGRSILRQHSLYVERASRIFCNSEGQILQDRKNHG